jgi:hypothetical protein
MTDFDRRHETLLRAGSHLAGSVRHVTRQAKADAKRNLPTVTHNSLVPAVGVVRQVLGTLNNSIRRIVGNRIPDLVERAWGGLKGMVDPLIKSVVSNQLVNTVTDWFGRLADVGRAVIGKIQQSVFGPGDAPPIDVFEPFDRIERGAEGVSRDAAVYIGTGTVWGIVDTPGVIGYTVMSQADLRVRPKHWRRHATSYFRDPVGKQLGYEFLPRPPFESPFDGYRRAFGCRCYLVPVLKAVTLAV